MRYYFFWYHDNDEALLYHLNQHDFTTYKTHLDNMGIKVENVEYNSTGEKGEVCYHVAFTEVLTEEHQHKVLN